MTKMYIILGIMIVVIVILKFFLKDFSLDTPEKKKTIYKYKRKDFLITKTENEFFHILIEILNNQYHVFTQVHLDAILDHKIDGQNWKPAFRHINEKSVDFVICDKEYLRPLLAIELDDKSHEREDRIERDTNVESILKDAGMPLLRIQNNTYLNKEEVRNLVLEKLN